MDLRKMMLPQDWYPLDAGEAERRLTEWKSNALTVSNAVAALVPHAGWAFSGEMAWNSIRQIPEDTELVIIAGGHLHPDSSPLVMNYDALNTPFGPLPVDREMVKKFCNDFTDDSSADNTVEIQLPMIKFHLPRVSVLPVRLPPGAGSSDWASMVASKLDERKTFFLGSSDLSHYGLRFGYADYGFGASARKRIRSIDADFLAAVRDGKTDIALDMADRLKCACSAGAAAAAAAFAGHRGALGNIEDHRYSYDVFDDDGDFVGYGTIVYSI